MREEGLSLATNGDIFFDGSGEIGAFRESLNHYFPRDLWLKKIASRCFAFSQYGQYNLSRALLRSDIPLLQYTRASALKEAAALFFYFVVVTGPTINGSSMRFLWRGRKESFLRGISTWPPLFPIRERSRSLSRPSPVSWLPNWRSVDFLLPAEPFYRSTVFT